MSSLLEKLQKNSTIKETDLLETSKFFKDFEPVPTAIPILNVALTGSFTGGVVPGLTVWAGASKNFKTCFSLAMANAYMTKYPDAVLLFYDSEFGAPKTYFKSFGIDMNKVIHTPILDLEEFKVDLMKQVNSIGKKDRVFILVDSLGNLASRKEIEDTEAGKSVADMTRAKVMKSIFRMVTPHLTMREIPLVVINHTYKSIGLFPQDIVGGGCLVKGTKIITELGTHKNVEDFVVGDLVQTLNGPRMVTATWCPETLEIGEPECYEITFEDGTSVVCSDKHKFIVDGVWVEAKDLVEGAEVKSI